MRQIYVWGCNDDAWGREEQAKKAARPTSKAIRREHDIRRVELEQNKFYLSDISIRVGLAPCFQLTDILRWYASLVSDKTKYLSSRIGC